MPCRNGWRWTGPARRGVGTRGRESSGSRGGPLGSIAVEEFAAAAVRAFSIEAITILAPPRLVARLAGEADGGVLRSDECRVGQECVRPCRSLWAPYH